MLLAIVKPTEPGFWLAPISATLLGRKKKSRLRMVIILPLHAFQSISCLTAFFSEFCLEALMEHAGGKFRQ